MNCRSGGALVTAVVLLAACMDEQPEIGSIDGCYSADGEKLLELRNGSVLSYPSAPIATYRVSESAHGLSIRFSKAIEVERKGDQLFAKVASDQPSYTLVTVAEGRTAIPLPRTGTEFGLVTLSRTAGHAC